MLFKFSPSVAFSFEFLTHGHLRVFRPYSKSLLTLNEWKFNLSISRVSLLFLNSCKASGIRYYVTTYPPAVFKNGIDTQKKLRLNLLHSLSVSS